MKPQFSFTLDAARHLIGVEMSGFYAHDDIARFRTGLTAALRQLNEKPNEHLMLVDIRQMKVQSQESVEGFRSFFNDDRIRSRRLAIVVASSLSRSQVKRAASGRGAEYFVCVADAEDWLLADPAPIATARPITSFDADRAPEPTQALPRLPAERWGCSFDGAAERATH